MKFNTDAADSAGMHPEGTWDAVVTGSEVKKSKSGRDMIQLTWKTSEGKIKTWHTWVEQYPGLFLDPLYAIGLTKEFFDSEPEFDEVALELLKRRCIVDVEHETLEDGRIFPKVLSYKPLPPKKATPKPAAPVEPVEDDSEPF